MHPEVGDFFSNCLRVLAILHLIDVKTEHTSMQGQFIYVFLRLSVRQGNKWCADEKWLSQSNESSKSEYKDRFLFLAFCLFQLHKTALDGLKKIFY